MNNPFKKEILSKSDTESIIRTAVTYLYDQDEKGKKLRQRFDQISSAVEAIQKMFVELGQEVVLWNNQLTGEGIQCSTEDQANSVVDEYKALLVVVGGLLESVDKLNYDLTNKCNSEELREYYQYYVKCINDHRGPIEN